MEQPFFSWLTRLNTLSLRGLERALFHVLIKFSPTIVLLRAANKLKSAELKCHICFKSPTLSTYHVCRQRNIGRYNPNILLF